MGQNYIGVPLGAKQQTRGVDKAFINNQALDAVNGVGVNHAVVRAGGSSIQAVYRLDWVYDHITFDINFQSLRNTLHHVI